MGEYEPLAGILLRHPGEKTKASLSRRILALRELIQEPGGDASRFSHIPGLPDDEERRRMQLEDALLFMELIRMMEQQIREEG